MCYDVYITSLIIKDYCGSMSRAYFLKYFPIIAMAFNYTIVIVPNCTKPQSVLRLLLTLSSQTLHKHHLHET